MVKVLICFVVVFFRADLIEKNSHFMVVQFHVGTSRHLCTAVAFMCMSFNMLKVVSSKNITVSKIKVFDNSINKNTNNKTQSPHKTSIVATSTEFQHKQKQNEIHVSKHKFADWLMFCLQHFIKNIYICL